MNKLDPHFVINAYEKETAVSKYVFAIDKIGLWESQNMFKKVIIF